MDKDTNIHPLMKASTQVPQNDYDSAFVKRPFLSLTVVCLWIGMVILVVLSFIELMFLKYSTSLKLFLISLLLFLIWFSIHKWAIRNPKLD